MYPAEIGWIRATSFDLPWHKMLAPLRTQLRLPLRRFSPAPLCLATMLSACAPPQPAASMARCPPGQGTAMTAFTLFFGRSMRGQGEVGDSAWENFLDRVITPNLSSGYTVFDATGAWLDPATNRTVHERTKVLLAVVPDDAANAAVIARIRQAYQHEYHQSSVGMTAMPVCAEF
jgi:hypothetical protein